MSPTNNIFIRFRAPNYRMEFRSERSPIRILFYAENLIGRNVRA
jgi:hypothetical protein